jgi:sigma-B regulation protein RsbU (phosphoserine phosphatase)
MLKFSMVLSAAMLLTILGLGMLLFFRFRDELFEDIKREGALGVTTLAVMGSEILEGRARHFEALDSLITEMSFYEAQSSEPRVREPLAKLGKVLETTKEETERAQAVAAVHLSRVMNYIGGVSSEQVEVLNAVVTKRGLLGDEIRIVGTGVGTVEEFLKEEGARPEILTLRTRQGPKELANITMLLCHYRPSSGEVIPACKFSRPIFDSKMKTIGNAYLTLSARRVKEITERMKGFLIVSSAICLGAGVCLSFLLASLVNRPLKHLLDDVRIVANGRLDHRALVRSEDEVGVLARALNQMTQSLKKAHQAELETQVLRRDMKIAKEVQAHLVPQEMPRMPGLDLTARYEPAREIGGDAFDLIPLSGERLGVVIADVAGKGVPGALYMAMTRIAFRVASMDAQDPAGIVTMVHRLIAPELTRGRFITAVYLDVDPRAGKVAGCRLGHDPILHYCRASQEIRSYEPRGAAIGIMPTEAFAERVEVTNFEVAPGDRILLYTDGITEAADRNGQEFGTERLNRFITGNAGLTSDQFVSKLIDEVKLFTQGLPLEDDLTVISIALPVAASAEPARADVPAQQTTT